MSSLRNAVARRPHRERGQIQSREKWGLLEKHKDYSLRAKDYNTKKKKIAQLSQKVREKNPDEFAFGMLSQGKAGLGKHKSGAKANGDAGGPLSHDAVKLLKTQDANYLRDVVAQGRKEMERLRQEVGMDAVTLDGQGQAKRKIFMEQDDTEKPEGKKRKPDAEVLEPIAALSLDIASERSPLQSQDVVENVDVEEDVSSTKSKPKSQKALAAAQDAAARLRTERKKRKRLQEMRVAKLEALKKRQREIMAAADQLDLQRAKMARTVGGVNKNGIKFKIRERKK
ncbi:uncharacterized protein A1O9_09985 [Exophiala aquamarina CBS 119918]|uniref:U3 small nucleolar RNA-associated protein 11 n=1 Tax=Exophiala aquamarina CBS 119918 TaxID=1182545 RepID=A0A072PF45_9EURO|nr:uncharacterized protein A1O9_09985 [Exophiala aquamarina CBS 119918]KEF54190.1 hypothetical protein A1O9_09985 [Exophiala aquamarina CBS 119918]